MTDEELTEKEKERIALRIRADAKRWLIYIERNGIPALLAAAEVLRVAGAEIRKMLMPGGPPHLTVDMMVADMMTGGGSLPTDFVAQTNDYAAGRFSPENLAFVTLTHVREFNLYLNANERESGFAGGALIPGAISLTSAVLSFLAVCLREFPNDASIEALHKLKTTVETTIYDDKGEQDGSTNLIETRD